MCAKIRIPGAGFIGLIAELSNISTRLSDATCDSYNQELEGLLVFIDGNKDIKEYIDSCGEPTLDLEAELAKPTNIIYRFKQPFDLGATEEEKVANIMVILRYIANNNFSAAIEIGHHYTKSTDSQEIIATLNQVFSVLTERIKEHLYNS